MPFGESVNINLVDKDPIRWVPGPRHIKGIIIGEMMGIAADKLLEPYNPACTDVGVLVVLMIPSDDGTKEVAIFTDGDGYRRVQVVYDEPNDIQFQLEDPPPTLHLSIEDGAAIKDAIKGHLQV